MIITLILIFSVLLIVGEIFKIKRALSRKKFRENFEKCFGFLPTSEYLIVRKAIELTLNNLYEMKQNVNKESMDIACAINNAREKIELKDLEKRRKEKERALSHLWASIFEAKKLAEKALGEYDFRVLKNQFKEGS